MKNVIATTLVALALATSGAANATNVDSILNPFDHATRTEVKAADAKLQSQIDANKTAQVNGDKALQSQITQQGYEINTQAKYTTSVNEDLQASKAAQVGVNNQVQGQLGALGGRVDATEHRLDSAESAIRDTQGAAQTANDRASALETRADVTEGAIRETNGAVQSVNTDLQNAKSEQSGINQHVQGQIADVNGKAVNAQNTADVAVGLGQKGINDAYNAQQSANHAEGTAQDAKNTAVNAQATADYAVGQGQKNANDIVNTNNNLNTAVKNQAAVNATQANTNVKLQNGINGAQSTANTALTNAGKAQASADEANAGLVKTNTVVAGHTTQLNQHTQLLNEYGQKFDVQDSLNSQFAADIGNVKSQMAGVQGQLNSQGKQIKQLQSGLAGVAALASIQFNTDPEAGFQVGCGVSQIRSNTGTACGAGGAINKNWFASGYVMQSGSESGVAASATYSFGR